MQYEVNVTTGATIVREKTQEEISAELDVQASVAERDALAAAEEAAKAAEEEALNALKESAMSKLSALGLTDEEIAAIIG